MSQSVYCSAPFNGFAVREGGSVKTCCMGLQPLGNLNQDSIETILESPVLKQIQQAMISGQGYEKNCQPCMEFEHRSGLSSLRQHYLRHYPNVYDELKLQNIDIRWNNICNLGCVYCIPMFSSVWEDRLSVRSNIASKPYQNDLMQFVLAHVDEVKEIMLVGGEPMLMKQNYELLKHLPESTIITMVTNFSYDLERLPCIDALLTRPKENVRWALSLENSGQQFEYVRNGASWSQVLKNFEFLDRHWHDIAVVNMVYSVFTAFDLRRAIEVFHGLNIKKFSFQTYYGPPALDVFVMPDYIRHAALDELNAALDFHRSQLHPEDVDMYPMENAEAIRQQLTNKSGSNSLTKQDFFKRIAWCDQWNSTKFANLWPHVVDLVEAHLP
jgi:organic radical activating enzyme